MRVFPPIHPGEILSEEFLKPMAISQYRLAKEIGVPPMRISKIVRGERGISADTALRLARYFGMSVEFWTGIQAHYEIETARMELGNRLEDVVKILAVPETSNMPDLPLTRSN
jgi:addiction module HigA family antidote